MKRHRFPTSSTTKVSAVLAAIRGFVFAATCLPVLAGCATAPLPPAEARHHEAAKELREARSKHEQRLGHYLRAAEAAGPLLGQGVEAPAVRDIYNTTVAECTILLRSAEVGRLWNQPLTITTGGTSYRLHYAPASRKEATWAPGYFTAFETPKQVHEDRIRRRVRDAGFGGTLVGINRPADPAKFYFPSVGVAAAVTAVLDFKPAAPNSKAPREVLLSLHDPTLRETVRIADATLPLAADFTAPLAYYPHPLFLGLMEAMRVDRYYRTAGLTMWQPYDPERIPIVFVHGLISEPGMWRDTIDAVESDPELRGRFQFWAFGYPTGDPISISALQLRESLAATRLGEVEDLARQAVESIVVGDPRDARTTMGPVASRIQYERVQSYIVRGIEEGATLLCGGPGRPAGLTRGYFVRPTVFSRVNNAMTIAREEIFGPVLAIIPYHSDQEAVDIANDTDYGLSSYVWSSDPVRAQRVAKRIRAGMVHINGAGVDLNAPYGGYKKSGNGREWGAYGLRDFLEIKAIMCADA